MLKPVFVAALAAFGLCACSADGDLSGNLEIGGTEPAYWTVVIDHAQARTTISILGAANLEGGLPVKSSGEGGAVLMTTKTEQGDFVMTFTHKECFDGLAETARPWTVTATWKGEALSGCAVPKA